MTTPITSALSPEAWTMRPYGIHGRAFIKSVDAEVWNDGTMSFGMEYRVQNRHALAALALHGRDFGFTRRDVDMVRALANGWDPRSPEGQRINDLAARIAALLPPEGT